MITSRSNSWFRRFRAAIEQHDDEIVLEGPKQIADAIAAGWQPLALAGTSPSGGGEIVFSESLFRSLSDTKHSQGALALFARPQSNSGLIVETATGPIVVLDGIQDPGNVGTIIRLAAAFEASGLLLTEGCADPWSQKSIRASAGTLLLLPIASVFREDVVALARQFAIPMVAAVAGDSGGDLPDGRSMIVLGSEGGGISPLLANASRPLSIEMSHRVESLNVAAAAAILLHSSYRSRGSLR